jgi:hypothetical protein
MANSDYPGPLHPVLTKRYHYQYFFYTKHHETRPSKEAQWLLPPQLTKDQEFGVFDWADDREFSDGGGNLYGFRPRDSRGDVPPLGTRGEQIARFPRADRGRAWHGYPTWPIAQQRDDEDLRPVPNEVLDKMVEKGAITARDRRLLRSGKHI